MVDKTTILNKENRKALKSLDNWLAKQPWSKDVKDIQLALETRTMITQIEDKGYYTESERELLNGVRNYWFEAKYAGQWVCRYCLGDTSQVDYDYLAGTDHLECCLKNEK